MVYNINWLMVHILFKKSTVSRLILKYNKKSFSELTIHEDFRPYSEVRNIDLIFQ